VSQKIKNPIDPVKQFRDFMKNTLRRAFFRYWERTKALQAARVDRGLYKCAKCLQIAKMEGHHIDHIDPVVDPKVGFVDWDVFINRLFCPAENLQLLCEFCHKLKTTEERAERKKYKTGQFALGRVLSPETRQKISDSHKGQIPSNLGIIQQLRKRMIIATNVNTGEVVEFTSLTETANTLDINIGNITTICKGQTKRKLAAGWTFQYKEEVQNGN
jgi:NUMOD3 motif